MDIFNCLHCNKENPVKRNTANKYCDNICQADYQLEHDTLPKFYKGKISNRRTLHRILKHLHGYKCVLCGNKGEYNGQPLALQLDHTDGNASNDMPSNLRLLCPNCHSQTDTFVAKNKGKGRQALGLLR
jgi:5-methylcytosine-specific restriction endonuclease McrA